MKEIKIPKYILDEVVKSQEYEIKKARAISKIFSYLEKQGIDTFDEAFNEGIGVRLANAEFTSIDEFESDINKFANGENVGYG